MYMYVHVYQKLIVCDSVLSAHYFRHVFVDLNDMFNTIFQRCVSVFPIHSNSNSIAPFSFRIELDCQLLG